jgi:aromatic-L-amino-acid decarboxylase
MADLQRSPFDPSLDEMRSMGGEIVELLSRFVDARYDARTSDYTALAPMLAQLSSPPPLHGRDLTELLQLVEAAAGKGFDPANPGFVGYIPGGGLFAAALADFMACVVNRYTGVAEPAPALVQLEAGVLRWVCNQFGLPPQSQGVLTPGGSMSTLSAVVAARATKLGETFADGTLYVSDEVHHSAAKSAQIAGLPRDAVRVVPTDDALRMDLTALRAQVTADRAGGRRPFLVVGSAGTISTGAVDPLTELAAVAAAEDLWFHVDAAYGGFFQLTERGRAALRGIEHADSITLDPHKGLFLPYGTGCLLARDGETLRKAHELHADYLPKPSEDADLPDFSSYTPELTRDFRGLRLWLPLHLHGVATFVTALDEKLDLAQHVYDELSAMPELDVPWSPDLSLVAFRPRGGSDDDARKLLDRLNGTGRLWLSTGIVRGQTYLRICILSHRTRPDRIQEALDLIRQACTAPSSH